MSEHRRAARESQAHVDALRAELEALALPVRQLNGGEVFRLLWERANPTLADAGRTPATDAVEVFGELDTAADREQARQAALALRGRLAQSSVDLQARRHLLELGRDVEQVIYVHTTAQQTSMGWLLGAMLTRAVHAQRARPGLGSPARAPADPARLPAVVRDQPRRRATRPRPGL